MQSKTFFRLRHTLNLGLTLIGLALFVLLGLRAVGQIDDQTVVVGQPKITVPYATNTSINNSQSNKEAAQISYVKPILQTLQAAPAPQQPIKNESNKTHLEIYEFTENRSETHHSFSSSVQTFRRD